MNKDQVIRILRKNRTAISPFHVRALYIFGSVARNEATENSDVDIMVEFEQDAHIGFFELEKLQRVLSSLVGHNVDLVTRDSLHSALKPQILKEAIYAA